MNADLSSLYYIIVGGEPMPIPLIELWHEKGVYIRQGFGMTEVGPNLFSLHHRDAIRKKGSIGRPNFYVDIKLVDEAGQEVPPNTPGDFVAWTHATPGFGAIPGYPAPFGRVVLQWRFVGGEEGTVVDRSKYYSGGENFLGRVY